MQDELVLDEARLSARRHAGEASLAGHRVRRQPQARGEKLGPVSDHEPATIDRVHARRRFAETGTAAWAARESIAPVSRFPYGSGLEIGQSAVLWGEAFAGLAVRSFAICGLARAALLVRE